MYLLLHPATLPLTTVFPLPPRIFYHEYWAETSSHLPRVSQHVNSNDERLLSEAPHVRTLSGVPWICCYCNLDHVFHGTQEWMLQTSKIKQFIDDYE